MQGVLPQYARGPRLESRRALYFTPHPLPVTSGGSVWVRARTVSSKGTVSLVPAWFRADSGTYLFKQGEIVMGRSSGSSARMVRESSWVRVPVGPCAFSSSVTFIP